MAAHFAFKLFSFHYALVLCRLLGKAKQKKVLGSFPFSFLRVYVNYTLYLIHISDLGEALFSYFYDRPLSELGISSILRPSGDERCKFFSGIERFTTGFSQKSNSAAQIHQSLFYGEFAFLFFCWALVFIAACNLLPRDVDFGFAISFCFFSGCKMSALRFGLCVCVCDDL